MNKYHIPNLENACKVLDMISNCPEGCRLKDISTDLNIPRTSALRITETLLGANYLSRNDSGALTLGSALVKIGVKSFDNLDIRKVARPILKALAIDTGESTHLAILNVKQSIIVEVSDSPHPIRIASRPGTTVDLHCSSTGKVFLAFSIPEPKTFCQTLNFIKHTEHTDSSIKAVLTSIDKTRKNGYAMDDEEYVLGVRCIAVPVFDAFGKTIAAIGITASTSTFPRKKSSALAKKLKLAAAEITKSMGFVH